MILSKSYKEVLPKITEEKRIYFIISSIKNYQYVQR